MSLRDHRNQVFEKLTPECAQPVLEEHGRVIANALCLGRAAMALPLFVTAASGVKGTGPALMRFGKALSDGLDGYAAEKDLNYETAEPSITSGIGMIEAAVTASTDQRSFPAALKALYDVLEDTDGTAADPDSDKIAQLADQFGNVIHGDLPAAYLLVNACRIGLIDFGVRPTYKHLGIKTSSTPLSQKKTNIHDAHQFFESTGLLDRFPKLRPPLNVIGTGVTILSGIDIMRTAERDYLASINQPYEHLSTSKLCLTALARTAIYLYGEDPTGVRPGSSSHPSEHDFLESPALPQSV